MSSAIKKGYKQTEVGVIPEDWEVKPLGKCLVGNPNYGINAAAIPYSESLPVYIRITDITEDGKFSKENITSVNNTSDSFFLQKGDLVFARTGASVGKTYLYNSADGNLVFAGFLIRVKSNPKLLLPEYLKYHTQRGYYWNWVRIMSMRSGQPGINGNQFKQLPVPIPPTTKEQSAIAEILTETDSLIANLEKLIAKKEAVKKGTIYSLLTGKKRLEGFNTKWKTKSLFQIGKPYGGLTGKSKKDFENGKFPYIPFMNVMSNPKIDTNYFDYVNIATSENQNRVIKGDLLFNGSSETPEEVGMCSVLLKDVPNLFLNSFCFGFRLNKELNTSGLFLSYLFRNSIGRKLFYSSAQGATRYNLSKANFLKIEIPLPEPEEQEMIAEVINDLENEILHLKDEVEKYQQIKNGLMQNLLTGKIRLV